MFRRILIPTDFSTASEWVFDDAVHIAGASGAEIVILHIRMTRTSRPEELRFPADPSLYEYAEQQELELLRDYVRNADSTIGTRLVVKRGAKMGETICQTAKEEGADLIVIATHARHHVAHLFIGSTTMSVITNPPVPVLAIRYGIRKRKAMQRIVVPVHPNQTSHVALDLAMKMAARENGEVHLITVCEDPQRSQAEALLAETAREITDVKTHSAILKGTDAEKEIVRYTVKNEIDAVFLNAAGSLSEKKIEIIRHAATPVMIVPA